MGHVEDGKQERHEYVGVRGIGGKRRSTSWEELAQRGDGGQRGVHQHDAGLQVGLPDAKQGQRGWDAAVGLAKEGETAQTGGDDVEKCWRQQTMMLVMLVLLVLVERHERM